MLFRAAAVLALALSTGSPAGAADLPAADGGANLLGNARKGRGNCLGQMRVRDEGR